MKSARVRYFLEIHYDLEPGMVGWYPGFSGLRESKDEEQGKEIAKSQ